MNPSDSTVTSTGVFDPGTLVYWHGQPFRVWWVSEHDLRRRWIRHTVDGYLKIVDIDELSANPPHRHVSVY